MKQVFFRIPQRAFVLLLGLLLSVGAFAQYMSIPATIKNKRAETEKTINL